jgi:NAD(P)-dependent dehydrogenase (short-subunit alcohol dehydrogenase family)
MGRLAGKVALVTGGGSGIGRATAELFAREGARVAVADRDLPAAEQTVAVILAAGAEASAFMVDVTQAESVAAMMSAVIRAYGSLNVLHNNAGITPRKVQIQDLEEAEWDRVINTNLKGAWLVCKYAIPALIAAGGGTIVSTASLAGVRARPYRVHYEASKAGVISLTRTLAIELSPHGIRANCVCPGGVDTPGRSASLDPNESAEHRQPHIDRLPIPRLARPEEVANAVLFLASDESSYVNGHALYVEGGEWAGTTTGLIR